jgi:hypothetical protein
MQPFEGRGEASATIERRLPVIYLPGSGGWQGFKEDLLPLMALLGAVGGWALALLVAVVVAIVLIVR